MPRAAAGSKYALVKTVQREIVLRTLFENGGRIEDKSGKGRATFILLEKTGMDVQPTAVTNMLKPMEELGLIKRDHIVPKRTHWIELGDNIPRDWLPELYEQKEKEKEQEGEIPSTGEGEAHNKSEIQEESSITDDELDKAAKEWPIESSIKPNSEIDYETLASHLLKSALDAISKADDEGTRIQLQQLQSDIEDARERLATVLSDNQRLRDKVREGEDLIQALHKERDGLRRQKQDLERVVATMQNPNNRRTTSEILGEIGRKDLERFMQQRPVNLRD